MLTPAQKLAETIALKVGEHTNETFNWTPLEKYWTRNGLDLCRIYSWAFSDLNGLNLFGAWLTAYTFLEGSTIKRMNQRTAENFISLFNSSIKREK